MVKTGQRISGGGQGIVFVVEDQEGYYNSGQYALKAMLRDGVTH